MVIGRARGAVRAKLYNLSPVPLATAVLHPAGIRVGLARARSSREYAVEYRWLDII
jgi:hypothetical protein